MSEMAYFRGAGVGEIELPELGEEHEREVRECLDACATKDRDDAFQQFLLLVAQGQAAKQLRDKNQGRAVVRDELQRLAGMAEDLYEFIAAMSPAVALASGVAESDPLWLRLHDLSDRARLAAEGIPAEDGRDPVEYRTLTAHDLHRWADTYNISGRRGRGRKDLRMALFRLALSYIEHGGFVPSRLDRWLYPSS